MVRFDKKGKRICSCGRIIKNHRLSICETCDNSYRKVYGSLGREMNDIIDNFIQHIKFECGYSRKKGNIYE